MREFNLSLYILKLLAVYFMTLSHLLSTQIIEFNMFYYLLGRSSFVIIAYLTACSIALSHNIKAYINKLLFTGFLCTPVYFVFVKYYIQGSVYLNILFQIAGSALLIASIKEQKYLQAFVALIVIYISDYSFVGGLLINMFYFFRHKISNFIIMLIYSFVYCLAFNFSLTEFIITNISSLIALILITISQSIKYIIKIPYKSLKLLNNAFYVYYFVLHYYIALSYFLKY